MLFDQLLFSCCSVRLMLQIMCKKSPTSSLFQLNSFFSRFSEESCEWEEAADAESVGISTHTKLTFEFKVCFIAVIRTNVIFKDDF